MTRLSRFITATGLVLALAAPLRRSLSSPSRHRDGISRARGAQGGIRSCGELVRPGQRNATRWVKRPRQGRARPVCQAKSNRPGADERSDGSM